MTHSTLKPAKLIEKFLPLIKRQEDGNGVLDLACGSGRNGLYLVENNISVIFADNDPRALEKVAISATLNRKKADLWQVDLEASGSNPLSMRKFDVVLVFNYLHRPLMDRIKSSLVEGGLILYETFTQAQAEVGRPTNPDFLLEPGELLRWFSGWELLHYFEGAENKLENRLMSRLESSVESSVKSSVKSSVESSPEGSLRSMPVKYFANIVARKPRIQ